MVATPTFLRAGGERTVNVADRSRGRLTMGVSGAGEPRADLSAEAPLRAKAEAQGDTVRGERLKAALLFQFGLDLQHVVVNFLAGVLGVVPQEIGGVEGGHQESAAVGVEASAEARDAVAGP